MSNNSDSTNGAALPRWRIPKGITWKIAAGAVVLVVGAFLVFGREAAERSSGTLFEVRKGKLPINVLISGSVEALEAQEIKSEVRGQTKILSIVEEGYLVTDEDVKSGKVLVTLDDSDLRERLTQEEISFQSALANYTDAREQYGIQVKQNESDISAAILDAKFALMEFEKYLGSELSHGVLSTLSLPEREGLQELETNLKEAVARANENASELAAAIESAKSESGDDAPDGGNAGADVIAGEAKVEAPAQEAAPEGDGAVQVAMATEGETPEGDSAEVDEALVQLVGEMPQFSIEISVSPETRQKLDFTAYADPNKLGDGEAKQTLRKFETDRYLAQEELQISKSKLDGTQRLFDKEFMTQDDLNRDKMGYEQKKTALESLDTEESLYIKYEFPKQCEKLLSDYEEALRKLERTHKQAIAKLAQAEAKKKSSEATYELQMSQRRELQEQIENCRIKAERTGLVVYASSGDSWRNQEAIAEGATVHEQQMIITIPDMAQMSVNAKVQESDTTKVSRGQVCTIKIEAHPEEVLTGSVMKLSVLPDSNRRWMNPDMKVYPCSVKIDGAHDWLKPTMTAQVEVHVKTIEDAVHVPLQAINARGDTRFVYVSDGFAEAKPREVTTGDFNDEFIEIKSGLEPGEKVLLRAPERRGAAGEASEGEKAEKPGAASPPTGATGGEGRREGSGGRRGGGAPSGGQQAQGAA